MEVIRNISLGEAMDMTSGDPLPFVYKGFMIPFTQSVGTTPLSKTILKSFVIIVITLLEQFLSNSFAIISRPGDLLYFNHFTCFTTSDSSAGLFNSSFEFPSM